MARNPLNIRWLGYTNELSKSFAVRTRGLFKKSCELEKICGVKVALVVLVDNGPVFIYNEQTARYIVSQHSRNRFFRFEASGQITANNTSMLSDITQLCDPETIEAATNLLHLRSEDIA